MITNEMYNLFAKGLAALALSATLSACHFEGPDSDRETFTLSFGGDIAALAQTRSDFMETTAETAVSSVLVACYDGDGALEYSWTQNDLSPKSFTMRRGVGHCLYALVNMPGLSAPESRDAMEAITYTIDSYTDMNSRGLPMSGWLEVPAGTLSGTVKLDRLVSKLTISLDVSSFFEPLARLSSLSLGDLLSGFNVHGRNLNSRLSPFGRSAATSASDLLPDGSEYDLDFDGAGNVTIYLPENLQGILLPSNTDPFRKNADEIGTAAAALCTCIDVDFKQDPGVWGVGGTLHYRIYPGQDITSDFNIIRNTATIMRLTASYPTVEKAYAPVYGGNAPLWPWKVISDDWTDTRSIAFRDSGYGPVSRGSYGTVNCFVIYRYENASRPGLSSFSSPNDDWDLYIRYPGEADYVSLSSGAFGFSVSAIVNSPDQGENIRFVATENAPMGIYTLKAETKDGRHSATIPLEVSGGGNVTWTTSSVNPSEITIQVGETVYFTGTYDYLVYDEYHHITSESEYGIAFADYEARLTTIPGDDYIVEVVSESIPEGIRAGYRGKKAGTTDPSKTKVAGPFCGNFIGVTIRVVDSAQPTVSKSLRIIPAAANLAPGSTKQFNVYQVTYTDGTETAEEDITSLCSWTSDNSGVATVSGGLVRGIAGGSATITATYNGMSISAAVNVTASHVYTLTFTGGPYAVARGSETTAGVEYSIDGVRVTNSSDWEVLLKAPGESSWVKATTALGHGHVASDGYADNFFLRTNSTTATGTWKVKARMKDDDSVSDIADLVVGEGLIITPLSSSIDVGGTQSYTLTYNGSAISNSSAAWSSADPSVASISTAGVAKGIARGTTSISAAYDGQTATAELTVALPHTLSLTPASATIKAGGTQEYVLRHDGNIIANSLALWVSSAEGIATVSPSGKATGISPGTTTITASYAGLSAAASLLVADNVTTRYRYYISPSALSLETGGKGMLKVVRYADVYTNGVKTSTGTVPEDVACNLFEWKSSVPLTASLSDGDDEYNMVATAGTASGTATITATMKSDASIAPTATVSVVTPLSLSWSSAVPEYIAQKGVLSVSGLLGGETITGIAFSGTGSARNMGVSGSEVTIGAVGAGMVSCTVSTSGGRSQTGSFTIKPPILKSATSVLYLNPDGTRADPGTLSWYRADGVAFTSSEYSRFDPSLYAELLKPGLSIAGGNADVGLDYAVHEMMTTSFDAGAGGFFLKDMPDESIILSQGTVGTALFDVPSTDVGDFQIMLRVINPFRDLDPSSDLGEIHQDAQGRDRDHEILLPSGIITSRPGSLSFSIRPRDNSEPDNIFVGAHTGSSVHLWTLFEDHGEIVEHFSSGIMDIEVSVCNSISGNGISRKVGHVTCYIDYEVGFEIRPTSNPVTVGMVGDIREAYPEMMDQNYEATYSYLTLRVQGAAQNGETPSPGPANSDSGNMFKWSREISSCPFDLKGAYSGAVSVHSESPDYQWYIIPMDGRSLTGLGDYYFYCIPDNAPGWNIKSITAPVNVGNYDSRSGNYYYATEGYNYYIFKGWL